MHIPLGLTKRTVRLGEALRQRKPRLVLCHADAHAANLHVGDDGHLWLVDWDEVTQAPREIDLLFALDPAHSDGPPTLQPDFASGYGDVTLDAALLNYYRQSRQVIDLGEFADQALLQPNTSPADRQVALHWFSHILASLATPL